MKKLLSSILSLIIFLAVGATGAGFYANSKAKETVEQAIETLKLNGYDLSSYDRLDIDFFKQTIHLKNLKIASSDQIWLKLHIDDIELNGIDPISDLSVTLKNSQLKNIALTYYGQNYKIDNITLTGLKTGYQPHFEYMLAAPLMEDKVRIFHEELDYESLSFSGFMLTDNLDNLSRIADGSYSKQQMFNNLPSQWRANLTGLEVSPAHLPPEFAQLLGEYNLKELNGILDISFEYQQDNHTGLFAINNLNFGGLANLQADILASMTDEKFAALFNIENMEENLNSVAIEHAELNYKDDGLYNYVIAQMAPKVDLSEAALKSQLYFGLALGSAQIINLDRRQALANPIADFMSAPTGLKIEISPAKPVRFQQYLDIYDANILVRDLNPTVTYIKE
ncbi:MAG: hypothetical protein OCD03_05335 [Hyphomicrobiales bacterium]